MKSDEEYQRRHFEDLSGVIKELETRLQGRFCGVHYDVSSSTLAIVTWPDPDPDAEPGSELLENQVARFQTVSSLVISSMDTITVGVLRKLEYLRDQQLNRCQILLEDTDGSANALSFNFNGLKKPETTRNSDSRSH